MTEGQKRFKEYWIKKMADPEFRRIYEEEARKKEVWLQEAEARLRVKEEKMAQVILDEFAPFRMREGVSRRKVFGMDSLLVNGNVFLSLSPTGVVYKMNEAGSQAAMAYAGADMFQPPMPNAPKMKGWVEVPFTANADWLQLAEYAFDYVSSLPGKTSKKK